MIISKNRTIVSINKNSSHDVMPRNFVFKSPDFNLGVKKITEQAEYNYHVHEDYRELVIISHGHANHIVDGLEYPIGPGDVFVIGEGQVHAYSKPKDIQINNILFDIKPLRFELYDLEKCPGFQFLFNIDPNSTNKDRFSRRFRLDSQNLTAAMKLVDHLEDMLDKHPTGYRFRSIGLFHQLLELLVDAFQGKSEHEQTIPYLLSKLISRMEENYQTAFKIEQMCDMTNLSRAVLFRQFKRYFNETPQNYLNRIRIEHASQMLLSSEKNIEEIAAATGFSDGVYFARRFRAATQMTPSRFRELYNRSR